MNIRDTHLFWLKKQIAVTKIMISPFLHSFTLETYWPSLFFFACFVESGFTLNVSALDLSRSLSCVQRKSTYSDSKVMTRVSKKYMEAGVMTLCRQIRTKIVKYSWYRLESKLGHFIPHFYALAFTLKGRCRGGRSREGNIVAGTLD